MNQFVGLITGLYVLAHSIFGCCAHHGAHAAEEPICVHAADEHCDEHSHNGVPHDPLDGDGDDSSTCSLNSTDRPHHDCPHAACQWVVTKSDCAGDLVQLDLNNMTAIAAISSQQAAATNTVAAFSDNSYSRANAPPLRRHLALGVLLI